MNNNLSIPGYARVLLIILPYMFIVGVFQFIGMLIANVNIEHFDISAITSQQHLTISFFDLIGHFLLLWIFLKYVDKESFSSTGFNMHKRLKEIFLGLFIGFLVMGLAMLGLQYFNQIEIKTSNFNGTEILQIFGIFVIVAIVEETLLRGYVLKNLMYSFNKYLALFVSSILFAIMHLANPNMDLLNFIGLFLAGILLGASYIFTKNLGFPIALHFSWNFFQSLFGFNVSGIDMYSLIEFEMPELNVWNGGYFGFEGSVLSNITQIILITLILNYYINGRKQKKQL